MASIVLLNKHLTKQHFSSDCSVQREKGAVLSRFLQQEAQLVGVVAKLTLRCTSRGLLANPSIIDKQIARRND